MNPRNTGEIEDPDAIGEVGNPRCGDIMKITMSESTIARPDVAIAASAA